MPLELFDVSKKIKEEKLGSAKGRLDAILGAKDAKKEEKPEADKDAPATPEKERTLTQAEVDALLAGNSTEDAAQPKRSIWEEVYARAGKANRKEPAAAPEPERALTQAEVDDLIDTLRAEKSPKDSSAAGGVSPSGKSIWEEVWEKHHPGGPLQNEPKKAPAAPKSDRVLDLEALYYGERDRYEKAKKNGDPLQQESAAWERAADKLRGKPVGPGAASEKAPVEDEHDRIEDEGEFVMPEKFERPEYNKDKKEWDGLSQFIKSKGLDPGKYGFDYKAVFGMKSFADQPDQEFGVLEVFENYHDYLARLQNLTEEERKMLDTGWESSELGKWRSPAVFSSGMDLDKPNSELYPYRQEIWDMMTEQKEGRAKDLYVEAVKDGQVKEIGRPEEKEGSPVNTEELKQAVAKARAEYIQAEAEAKKAGQSVSKLSQLRAYLFSGKKEVEDKKEGGVKADKKEAEKFSEEKRIAYEEAKKVFRMGLYDEKIKSFEEKIQAAGGEGAPMTPEKQAEALAELRLEIVKEAILDEKKTLNDEKFAALPEKERGICMKAMARYGQLPQWSKIMISAGAATGATLAFSSGVGFAAVGGIYAWKAFRATVGTTAGLLAGKGYNWVFDKIVDTKNIKTKGEQEIIDEIKDNLLARSEEGEFSEGNEVKFEKWLSQASAWANQELDYLAKKEKRILLGKAIGQGVVIAGVAGLTSMGMEKGMANLNPDLAAKMGIRVSAPPDSGARTGDARPGAPGNIDSRYTAQKGVAPGDNFDSRFTAQKGVKMPALEALGAPKASEILNLKIGARGPEGAIIDNFKANPKLAESFGYDPKGKISLDKWAGTKAHQLWLESAKADLKNPKIVAELAKHGYAATPEDYARAMHKIGKGSVEIDLSGKRMHLTDDTSFLKKTVTVAPPEQPGIIVGDQLGPRTGAVDPFEGSSDRSAPAASSAESGAENAAIASESLPSEKPLTAAPKTEAILSASDSKIKEAVARLMGPEVMKDATFKAGAKIPLGKILTEVPPEIYGDKYALSRYWQGLKEPGVHTPDLPGSGWIGLTFSDFEKYAKMAKFLRENVGDEAMKGLKNLTVREFLEKYGSGLGKGTRGGVLPNMIESLNGQPTGPTPSTKINLTESSGAKFGAVSSNLPEPTPGGQIDLPQPVKITGAEKIVQTFEVTPAKQAIIGGIIDSKSSTSVVDLVANVRDGKLSVEDIANYYAQNIKNTNAPAVAISSEVLSDLKEMFTAAEAGNVRALRAIQIALDRLRQGK